MKALFVSGVPDNGKVDVITTAAGGLNVVMSGSSNLAVFLSHLPGDKAQFYLAGRGGDQRFSLEFWPDIIVNEISDPDSHQQALSRCIAFCQQQAKPVINSPQAILNTTRDQIPKLLADIDGLNIPPTVRLSPTSPEQVLQHIQQAQMNYPVIFRASGDHGGISTVRIDSEQALNTALHAYALDGRDYYLTQYVDCRSQDGCYRKYRIAVVDGKPFLRHLIISDQWLVHAGNRRSMENNPLLAQEEQNALESFPQTLVQKIAPTIAAISDRLQLDYYGIDCHIDEAGNILCFEINANMNILINSAPSPNIWDQPIEALTAALTDLIVRKAAVTSSHG